MRQAPALATLVALLGMPLFGQAPAYGQVGLEEVTNIRFVGNRQFSDQVLASALNTRETECRSVVLAPFCWLGSEFSLDRSFYNDWMFRADFARVLLFYWERGYREAVVDSVLTRPGEGEVEIEFRIQEGDPVRIVQLEFDGIEELADSSLLEDLPVRVGDPFNRITVDATRDTLIGRLRNTGYAQAEVLLDQFVPRETPYEAQITFLLFPGPLTRFGPIGVEGNVTVDERVVRRMLPFREGHVFSQDLQFAGQRNLYNLEIFNFANVVPTPGPSPDSVLPLTVRVSEGDLHRVRAGAGLGTADCLNAEVRWASRNFFGGARRLQLTGRVSNVLASSLESTLCPEAGVGEYGGLNGLLAADFTQPWLLTPRNSLVANLFWEHQALPGIFIREALGATVGLTHTLTISTPFTFSFRPQISWLEAAEIFFCSNYLICAPADIDLLQRGNRLFPIGVSLSQDRRNQALSPTRGYSASVDLEHAAAWTASEFLYTRLLADGTWYTQNRAGWVVAAHLRAGWVRPGGFRGATVPGSSQEIIHPEKRLYAGGANSVRGFAQNRLGPKVLQVRGVEELLFPTEEGAAPACMPEEVMDLSCDPGDLSDDAFAPRPTGGTSLLEGSLELRFPVASELWEGATFLDFGQVWEERRGVDLTDLELSPGVGVRFFSPIGPIRVDLAYRLGGGDRLQVVTPQIRPSLPGEENQRLRGPDGAVLDYVVSDDQELALLSPRVSWGDLNRWSLRRFQIHLSIGQAF